MQNRILGSAKMEQTHGTCIIFIFNDRKILSIQQQLQSMNVFEDFWKSELTS